MSLHLTEQGAQGAATARTILESGATWGVRRRFRVLWEAFRR